MVLVAVTQMACTEERTTNLDVAEALVRQAAADGAQIVLLQELFEGPYFCQDRAPSEWARAVPEGESVAVARMQRLASELEIVLPVSFYERDARARYNTVSVIDADGARLGVYRKSHIPDDPGYREKYYFSEGNTGFRVWNTRYGRLGVGICWDQWFPEAARVMALMGADILLFPTAIGTDPLYPGGDPMAQWQRCMQGHAAANFCAVLASNRVGLEPGETGQIEFLGSSFICDHHGEIVASADRRSTLALVAELDLETARKERHMWHLFHDRRPDLYGLLTEEI